MIRTLRLTDVVAYLAFRNRAALNEALLQPEDTPSTPSLRSSFLGRYWFRGFILNNDRLVCRWCRF